MPCYANTIVKIKHVHQKESNNQMMPVWAIRTYPMGRDDNEIELTIYVPVDSAERDLETQAIFKREECYSVRGKIIPSCYTGITRSNMTVSTSTYLTIIDKGSISNKYPLKVSLTGTPQDMPTEINNTNGIVEIVMTDYVNNTEDNSELINNSDTSDNHNKEKTKKSTKNIKKSQKTTTRSQKK
ncbi:7748_t:CDS:2, partial [Scutellospora calospora]